MSFGKIKILAAAFVMAALSLFAAMPMGFAAELVILHINDMHGRIASGDDRGKSIGLAQMSAAVKAIKAENSDVLWLDAGDTFHGLPRITVSTGENMIPLFKAMEIDGSTPGNHDFNYGTAQLKKLAGEAGCPIVSANVAIKGHEGEFLLPRYHIYELPDGLKVAVFGLTTPETAYKTNPNFVKDIVFLDPVEEARKMIKELRPKCDVLIALMHMGVDPHSEITSERIAKEAPGIDVIIDGHSHTELPEGIAVGETLIAQAGCYTHLLGQVTVDLDDNKKITAKRAELMDGAALKKIAPAPDPKVLRVMEEIERKNSKILDKVVATSDMDLPFNIGLIRTKETEVGNFVADAMRFVSAADVAIVNAGSIRGSLSKGKVTRGELLNMCPFGNIVERTESDGATLRKALENSVAHYPQPVGSLAQVSGLEFTFDPALPPGKRVLEVKVGGKPLDDKRIYILTVTDFMLAGGDGYTMLKSLPITGVFGTMDEVLAKYLSQKTPEKTELNRIKMTEATASRR